MSLRRNAGIAAVGVIASVVLLASSPAGGASCGGTGGGVGACSKGYVNPLKHRRWYAGRIDMGVDYMPIRRTAVVAIGDAKVLGSDSHSGWPGGHFIWYRLLNGDHKGAIIYVAEHLKHMVPAGTRVQAGERIATAIPHGSGTEWGWATADGQARAHTCYSEGMKTNSGKQMARFLKTLGAEVATPPKPGPDYPSGKRC